MPITINGSGTLTGISAGGLPDAIITQPELAANVAGNGPAFSAYPSASQSIANGTFTKINVNTELFDTNSNFDKDTNYRFTPTVAGYYQVSACWYSATTTGQVISCIYKNGAGYQSTSAQAYVAGNVLGVNSLVYMNGSTDYLEFYVYQGQGTSYSTLSSRSDLNYFQASMVRAA